MSNYKKMFTEFIRSKYPNIPALRKIVSKRKIQKLSYYLTDQEIEKGETDDSEKVRLVKMCANKWPDIAAKAKTGLNAILETSPVYKYMDDKQKKRILVDAVFCRFAYGFVSSEYLCYKLENKTASQRRSFISEREHILFYYQMNDLFDAQIFNDKMKTYQKFSQYYHRDIISIQKESDFEKFRAFVKKHPIFVKKDVYESCGKSIELIRMDECKHTERELFSELVSHGKTIIEECIVQHETTAIFNSSSVNTVRCITFNTNHGILAPYFFMKIGRKGSFVDNGGSGGIFVGIDAKTGVLATRGIDELCYEYDVHPDSGIPFVGYQLPKWEDMISMCKKMSAKMPNVKYIGWDLAYTENEEWVVVEGNGLSQFIGPQSTFQRGIKAEVEELMQDMDLMC